MDKEKVPQKRDVDIESVIVVLKHIKECLENSEKQVGDIVYDWCRQNPGVLDAERLVRNGYSENIGYAISLLAQMNG